MSREQDVLSAAIADQISTVAIELSKLAHLNGLILTIETKLKPPLAMGNYSILVDVRPSHRAYRSKA